MQGIRVRKAILGAGGVVAEGIYNSNLLLVETERQMMSCGQEVVIVADHTKFGRLALARLCGLDEVQRVVTDPGLARRVPGRARRRGRAAPPGRRRRETERRNGDPGGPRGATRHGETGMSTLVSRDQVESLVRSILRQQQGGSGDGNGRRRGTGRTSSPTSRRGTAT